MQVVKNGGELVQITINNYLIKVNLLNPEMNFLTNWLLQDISRSSDHNVSLAKPSEL